MGGENIEKRCSFQNYLSTVLSHSTGTSGLVYLQMGYQLSSMFHWI